MFQTSVSTHMQSADEASNRRRPLSPQSQSRGRWVSLKACDMLVGTRTTTPTGCNSCTFDKDRRAVEVSTSYTGRRDDSRPQQTAECLMLRSHVRASVGLNPGTGEVESRSTWGGVSQVISDITLARRQSLHTRLFALTRRTAISWLNEYDAETFSTM